MAGSEPMVDVDLSADEGVEGLVPNEEVASVVASVLAHEGVARPCAVSVSLVGDARMRELNLEWRGVDAATDVLSLECERPDDPDLAPGEPCELGDIVLAPAFVAAQATRFSTTPADECRLLLVHATLHLLGHDHLDDESAEAMEALEDEILRGVPTDGTMDHVAITRHRTEEGDQP